ncbi:MAG: hypothetical protein IJ220_07030 [Clostridia bacterium]|nr:hypothetical protein [Clostridia bacterium]
MKKILIFLTIFFWSMIFPSFSFNQLTTDITGEEVQYLDLFQKESRKEILQNATFDFYLFQ